MERLELAQATLDKKNELLQDNMTRDEILVAGCIKYYNDSKIFPSIAMVNVEVRRKMGIKNVKEVVKSLINKGIIIKKVDITL